MVLQDPTGNIFGTKIIDIDTTEIVEKEQC
jgi:hypothetical protein